HPFPPRRPADLTAGAGNDYSPALATAISNAIAALTISNPGHGISFNSGTGELTFTGGGATALAFSTSALNDQLVDNNETIIATLTAPTVSNGTATLVSGQTAATATITDLDSAVTFNIAVASDVPGNDGASAQAATITEEGASDHTATYTVTLGGTLVSGQTATVTVTGSGSATA